MAEEDSYPEELVIEDPEYSNKSQFNKPKMVETIINRALELRARSMHPAYVNTSVSTDGTIKSEHIEDSRQAYVNAVKAVIITLYPELSRDDENRKQRVINLQKREKEIFEKYAYEEREHFATPLTNGKYEIKKTGLKFIPENDQILGIDKIEASKPGAIKGTVVRVKGYWNQQTNLYWAEMINISDQILSELQALVDKLNYFKTGPRF